MGNKINASASEPSEPSTTTCVSEPCQPPPLPEGARPGSRLYWLPRLYLRPRKFFLKHARWTSILTVIFCICICGFAAGLTRALDPSPRDQLPKDDTGANAIAYSFGQGLLIGPLWYFLGGTWYGMRLRRCKPQGMTWKLARRAYVFSELTYALPSAILMCVWWVTQDRRILLLAFATTAGLMFWSLHVSYRGVRTLFQASRRAALVLFVVLPALAYAAALGGPSLLRYARQCAGAKLASVPVAYEDSVFKMDRPANWVSKKSPEPGFVVFDIPDAGMFLAGVRDFPDGEADLAQTARAVALRIAEKAKTPVSELDHYEVWGRYAGRGIRFRMTLDGADTIVRVFCSSLPDNRILMVEEGTLVAAENDLQKQFEIVRNSLQIKPAK